MGAAARWNGAALAEATSHVDVDASGTPSRAKRMRHTDDLLALPRADYSWGKGDKVLVGWSWLPFLDLGNPGDGSDGSLDGVFWMPAQVISMGDDGFATI